MFSSRKARERFQYWMFIAPALIFLLAVCIIPMLFNFYYAVFDWNGISSTKKFVGLNNFVDIFTKDVKFKRSVSFTARYTIGYVLLSNIFALAIAVVLVGSKRCFFNIGRTAYYIPCITASAATGLMWKFIFRNGTKSIYAMTGIEIFAKSWLGSVDLSFYSILIVGVWGSVGFYNIIYIAALLAVPGDTLEAATIDGANPWQRFWKVTFPQIMPTFSTCLLLSLINGFKVFDAVMLVTDGGPAGMTMSMAFSIYSTAFQEMSYGMASAKALVFFAVLVVLTVVELAVTRKVSEV